MEQTEIEKAEQLLKEVEAARQKEFVDKINALCTEYGYNLQPVATIQIIKTN